MRRALPRLALVIAVAWLAGCVTYPQGPSVMALPGSQRPFEVFQRDDAECRDWAGYQTGVTADQAAADAGVGSAAVGTAIGALVGTALGALSGNPAAGAAIGAGSGLFLGAAAGASNAHDAGSEVQRRYDAAYTQCMYANGHRVPLPRRSLPYRDGSDEPRRRDVPPPPRGRPPPPPPDVAS